MIFFAPFKDLVMGKMLLFLKGVAMGAADVVPGVSGGTIAFITGIYEELIHTIKAITAEALPTLFKEGLAQAWQKANANWLLTLLAGIALSFLSLAKGISYLLDHHAVLVWGFFFGLILASAWVIGKTVERWNFIALLGLAAGTLLAYYITIAAPAQSSEAWWFIIFSGALAICAMILPGISGSFILLLLGKYRYILESLAELRLEVILLFLVGCVLGLLSFARLLSWMFAHYRNITLAVLTGFMLGSLNKVWPWKETLTTTIDRHGEEIPILQESVLPQDFAGNPQLWAVVGLAILAAALIVLLERANPNSFEAE